MSDTVDKDEVVNVAQFNADFVQALQASDQGNVKEATTRSSKMIRKRIRENGYWRHVIKPETVTTGDLHEALEHDNPRMIDNMEPDSPAAKSIPFNDGPDIAFYRGDKFEIVFFKITTAEFAKNIHELRTYSIDLRQVITENALKDIQTEEDLRAIRLVDRLVGSEVGVGASGVQQNFLINGAITRQSYRLIKNHLEDMDLNNGVFLINRHTANEFIGFDRNELGGDKAEAVFLEGLAAFDKLKILGVPHIATIKRTQVPDNVVYQFAEPGYLGRFYILEDVTMYVERRRDILRFNAEEKIGCTIANVRAVTRARFSG